MLQIQDLASRRNGQPFLNGVTLAIPDGQTVLLTGRADCGKSALLRIVGGLEKYSRGTIRFDDLPTHADQLRRIAYFTAKGTLPPFLSADGVAELASLFWTNFDAEGYTYRLRKMDIPQRQPLSRLTAYERSCIELACGMARGCVYLLLDSTFSADVRTASLALQSVLSSFPDRFPAVERLVRPRRPRHMADGRPGKCRHLHTSAFRRTDSDRGARPGCPQGGRPAG